MPSRTSYGGGVFIVGACRCHWSPGKSLIRERLRGVVTSLIARVSSGMASKQTETTADSDSELRKDLQKYGFSPGPITATTRDVLARKLKRLSLGRAHT